MSLRFIWGVSSIRLGILYSSLLGMLFKDNYLSHFYFCQTQFSCNAHTICDSELRPQGIGLFPFVSIINHRYVLHWFFFCVCVFFTRFVYCLNLLLRSCSPNAILVFEEQKAVVRAMENITKDSEVVSVILSLLLTLVAHWHIAVRSFVFGQVTISYIETAGSTLTRQKSLKEQYLFHCQCARCNNVVSSH